MTLLVRTYPRSARRIDHPLLEKLLESRHPSIAVLVDSLNLDCGTVPRFTSEFWTSKQRQGSSLQEVSYRACFKPQLPRFFIERFTQPGEVVYDPFMGRGTTLVEAALRGRVPWGNDVNPLSKILVRPRFHPPLIAEVEKRISNLNLSRRSRASVDLSMFYHSRTESEIVSLRRYLLGRQESGRADAIDRWIRMVATNRLTGHSKGFFSVYTLPPNQALSPDNQRRINRLRKQKPEYRDVRELVLKKTRSLLRNLSDEERLTLHGVAQAARILSHRAWNTSGIADDSIHLTVTSPPFLDTVDYAQDNWLRCWFNGIDRAKVADRLTVVRSLDEWCGAMSRVFCELYRMTSPNGVVAFEVGEIRKRNLRLDEIVVPLGTRAGFRCVGVLINLQRFTKTSNIWGVSNNRAGTNTNRIVIFQKSH